MPWKQRPETRMAILLEKRKRKKERCNDEELRGAHLPAGPCDVGGHGIDAHAHALNHSSSHCKRILQGSTKLHSDGVLPETRTDATEPKPTGETAEARAGQRPNERASDCIHVCVRRGVILGQGHRAGASAGNANSRHDTDLARVDAKGKVREPALNGHLEGRARGERHAVEKAVL